MDDFNINSLVESKNEWCMRLLNILTPSLIKGIKSIFDEAFELCQTNDNEEKYLMTFQNLLNNIPKWTDEIVKIETDRIIEFTGCNYLEDLLSCVHIVQLKSLTCARAGLKQKKIDINIPNIYQFIHKTYILLARKIYVNVYLFEKDIRPLEIQKNNRELELLTKEAILNSIRDSIPLELILKNYLDESQETDVVVEEKREEVIDKEAIEMQKEKELEKIKNEIRAELKQEEANKLADVNKDLNNINNESIANESIVNESIANESNSNETNSNKAIVNETIANEAIDNELDDNLSNYSDDKSETLKISDLNLDLEIKDLDDNDLFTNELVDEPEINLDIEEL